MLLWLMTDLGPYLPSVLWHCWLGHLTHKNPSRYNLQCVWWDIKPRSIYVCQTMLLRLTVTCLELNNHYLARSYTIYRWYTIYNWYTTATACTPYINLCSIASGILCSSKYTVKCTDGTQTFSVTSTFGVFAGNVSYVYCIYKNTMS